MLFRSALGLLFLRHHVTVFELCFRLTGESHTADDLVQETFLRVLKYRNSFEGSSSFSTWIYRVTRNVCFDNFATRKRRKLAQFRALGSLSQGMEPSSEKEDERLEHLKQALLALPLEKREVLVLSKYHALSHAEIANICTCSVSAVKVRVHRALHRPRHLYCELDREHDAV